MSFESQTTVPEIKTDAIDVFVRESNLPKMKTDAIMAEFKDYTLAKAVEWKKEANNLTLSGEDDTDGMAKAKELRLEMRDRRLAIAEIHKKLKADALKEGSTLDYIKRTLTNVIVEVEDIYEKKEKFGELKKLEWFNALIDERSAILLRFQWAESEFPAANLIGNMDQSMWEMFLSGVEKRDTDRKEAEKKAEDDRLAKEKADTEQREKDRLENIRMRAEKEKQDKVLAAERARVAEEKKKADAKLDKERKDRLAAEAELKKKQDAEVEEKRKAKAEERKAARAPDKDKLLALAKSIDELPFPSFSDDTARAISGQTRILLDKTTKYIRDQVGKMDSE